LNIWNTSSRTQNAFAINKGNREALVDLLRESGDKVVELYGIWDGDFVEAPKVQENIAAETILDSGFLFKERGFLQSCGRACK